MPAQPIAHGQGKKSSNLSAIADIIGAEGCSGAGTCSGHLQRACSRVQHLYLASKSGTQEVPEMYVPAGACDGASEVHARQVPGGGCLPP